MIQSHLTIRNTKSFGFFCSLYRSFGRNSLYQRMGSKFAESSFVIVRLLLYRGATVALVSAPHLSR